MTPLQQHQLEIERNLASWQRKPLLQEIYRGFYQLIVERIDATAAGRIVELGSGIGNLKAHLPQAICSDLFPNRWLDLVCDAYELPFADGTLSHLVLFDVFHHLERPGAFLTEARRVLRPGGKVILFEPFISATSYPVYALLHHEPVAMRASIEATTEPPTPRAYYAAQGNATRLFFQKHAVPFLEGFSVTHARAYSAFSYLLSGGYSKPALYPQSALGVLRQADHALSRFPRLFGARCLVELQAAAQS